MATSLEALLAYYSVDQTQKGRISNGLLLLPPLFITIVFAFSFIMLQPHNQTADTTANKAPSETDPLNQVLSSNTFDKVNTMSVQGDVGGGVQTTTPQTNNLSISDLQNANSDGDGMQINVPQTTTKKHKNVKVKSSSSSQKLHVENDNNQY